MSLIGEENLNKPNLRENSIEEVRLKNRRSSNKEAAERMGEMLRLKRLNMKLKRKEDRFWTPERILADNRRRLGDKKRFKRQEKRADRLLASADTNEELIIIIRILDSNESYRGTENVLKELKLEQKLSLVFARKTPELLRKLVIVGPYVAWGHPSRKVVSGLMTKHAFAMIDGKRVAISDNNIVEDHLGSKDIICVADMEKEIISMGPAFDDVNNFLAPFVMTSHFSKRDIQFLHKNKLPSGEMKEEINTLLSKMI